MAANRTQQNKILAAASADGTIGEIYWYLTIRHKGRDIPAVQGESIPVQPAGPDVEVQRHWAHVMLELARAATPELFLDLELTTEDLLAGMAHHVWHDLDLICPVCAGIGWDCVCQPNVRRVEQ